MHCHFAFHNSSAAGNKAVPSCRDILQRWVFTPLPIPLPWDEARLLLRPDLLTSAQPPHRDGAKHIHRTELLKEVTKAKQIVIDTLKNISSEQLTEEFPIQVWGEAITNEFFLTHLHGHFTYHLGQMSYQRRILDR